ncbi:MAG TPA: hypothetical protein VH370_15840 [Humisphaera sp.]|jgi:hypothetical protein|nr:hypothetical protein [Humisphaera sp.]
MRYQSAALLLALLLASPLWAAEDPSRIAQIDAARSDAIDALRREILAASILPDATVQNLVEKAGGEGVISKALTGAQQMGGPRWIDDQTCQITMSIEGETIAKAVEDIARTRPRALSVSPQELHDKLKRWSRRTFSAVGTSIGWSAVDRLHPDPAQANWQMVSDDARRKAIGLAKQSAVAAVLESLKPVALEGTHSIGEVLALPAADVELRKWLSGRPITAVQFRDNLEIRLALSVAPQEFWPVLKEILQKQKAVPVPTKTADWIRVREQMIARMAPPIGSGMATPDGGAPQRQAIALPAQPPRWVSDAIDATGTAGPAGSALRTARAAESAAGQQLRDKINALVLTPGLTLADAAHQDARIEQAITRSIARAHISKVDYDTPTRGSVRAKLSLNLEDLWREMNSQ